MPISQRFAIAHPAGRFNAHHAVTRFIHAHPSAGAGLIAPDAFDTGILALTGLSSPSVALLASARF